MLLGAIRSQSPLSCDYICTHAVVHHFLKYMMFFPTALQYPKTIYRSLVVYFPELMTMKPLRSWNFTTDGQAWVHSNDSVQVFCISSFSFEKDRSSGRHGSRVETTFWHKWRHECAEHWYDHSPLAMGGHCMGIQWLLRATYVASIKLVQSSLTSVRFILETRSYHPPYPGKTV